MAEAVALPPLLQSMASPRVRLATLGGMGALCLIALIVIIAKTATAKPRIIASDAEEQYRQGLKLFSAKDYEGAKVSFNEALTTAPDSPEAKRYLGQCDAEVHARGAMQGAERALAAKRYGEALKSLDAVDSQSLLHDQAVKLHKDNAPRAAQEAADEARALQTDDPDTAKMRLTQALAFDPFNAEARQLAGKLHVDVPPLPAGALSPPAPAPPAPVAVVVAPAVVAPKHPHAVKDDGELAPVKMKPVKDSSLAKVEPPSSGAALAAYRTHDFVNAERLYRLEASKQSGKQMEKSIAYANQVRDLRLLADKAGADEPKNPAAAMKEYEDAAAADARIGRGINGVYFKQRIGKLQIPIAQQAFAQGHFDQAFTAVQQAQKLGAGDGGLMAKLDAKAQELTNKGVAVQKTNLPQAKQYWRQVLKMVPTGSPTYNKAYTLVNNSGGAHRDEDED